MELWARARAWWQAGDLDRSRKDLEACRETLGDLAEIELAFLDIRSRGGLGMARERAERIAGGAPPGGPLWARAQHVLGLAEGKLRRISRAARALEDAAEAYEALGDSSGLAQVLDTQGMLYASTGRLDLAAVQYARSLARKAALGDRYGTALTLGNLGRLHLRAGRAREAAALFRDDLVLAREIGDQRACIQIEEELGRCALEEGDPARAEDHLRRALRGALERSYEDLAFFACKELARLLARSERVEEARTVLSQAEALVRRGGEPYHATLLLATRGEILRAARDPSALDALERAARDFARAELVDLEIETLITLAQAYLEQRTPEPGAAEDCLAQAAARARSDGYARHLPRIRALLERLEIVPGLENRELRAPRLSSEDAQRARSVLGGYVLLERLGAGTFGEVWRAADPELLRQVALKEIRLESIYDADERESLTGSMRQELDAVSRERHPGVARVWDLSSDHEGRVFVIQEYVKGLPLSRHLTGRPDAELASVLQGLRAIALTLDALHPHIVHCDLKPANIVLRHADGKPVLIDFGIARVLGPRPGWMQGRVLGTRHYMSPEQAAGKEVDGSADVYALGVIAFEWLTGVRPLVLREGSLADLVADLTRRPPARLDDYRPGLPGELVELVDSMLAKKPARRPTALRVALACETLLDSIPRAQTSTPAVRKGPTS